MAVSAAAVASWGRFTLPTGADLDNLTRVIAAATERLSRDYYLDPIPSAAQETAILLVSARLWKRRDTPEGRDAFGGDIAVSISPEDADAVALLVPRVGLA